MTDKKVKKKSKKLERERFKENRRLSLQKQRQSQNQNVVVNIHGDKKKSKSKSKSRTQKVYLQPVNYTVLNQPMNPLPIRDDYPRIQPIMFDTHHRNITDVPNPVSVNNANTSVLRASYQKQIDDESKHILPEYVKSVEPVAKDLSKAFGLHSESPDFMTTTHKNLLFDYGGPSNFSDSSAEPTHHKRKDKPLPDTAARQQLSDLGESYKIKLDNLKNKYNVEKDVGIKDKIRNELYNLGKTVEKETDDSPLKSQLKKGIPRSRIDGLVNKIRKALK